MCLHTFYRSYDQHLLVCQSDVRGHTNLNDTNKAITSLPPPLLMERKTLPHRRKGKRKPSITMSSEDTRGGYVTVHKVGEAMGSKVRERRREVVMGELGDER